LPLADYAHWNEDAQYMWWHEEGKHSDEPSEPDPYDRYDHRYEDYECQDAPKECLQNGNFDMLMPAHGPWAEIWQCSSCEHLFQHEGGEFLPIDNSAALDAALSEHRRSLFAQRVEF